MKKTTIQDTNQATPKAAASLSTKLFDFIEGTEITTGSQSKDQTLIFKDRIDSDMFRISIKDDSYANQSYARLDKWSETNGWLLVMQLPLRELIPTSIAHRPNGSFDKNYFSIAIIRLQDLAYNF